LTPVVRYLQRPSLLLEPVMLLLQLLWAN